MPPLQVLRAHHTDPALPDLALVMVVSAAGGILQGDRLEIGVRVEAGARLHLGSASATRIYRMPADDARLETSISVGPGCYVEHVPDPYLPYSGSRFLQRGTHVVAEDGVLILGEVVAAGRQARGEELAYRLFSSVHEVLRPDGRLLFRDACRLEPSRDLSGPAMLGCYRALGSLYVVSRGFDADLLAEAMEAANLGDSYRGCSQLPAGAGAWMRVLAADSQSAAAAVLAAWRAARMALTGADLPESRRC